MKRIILTIVIAAAAALAAPMPVRCEHATVEKLEAEGHTALNDRALEEFIVGKVLTVWNHTTDQLYEITFFADGYRLLVSLRDDKSQGPGGIATYEISNGRLVTRYDGGIFDVSIFEVDGKYLIATKEEGGAVSWELTGTHPVATGGKLTASALRQGGIEPLDDDALRRLVVGRTLTIHHRGTDERYEGNFRADGLREMRDVTKGRIRERGGDDADEPAPYDISGGRLNTVLGGRVFKATIFEVGGKYLASRSDEGGIVNWEIIGSR